MSTAPPALPADIEAGLRRLRLRAMRSLSPELLVTAKTQRWKPEEFLRTLVEAEILSRDASNVANRLRVAAFPVTKTLDEFDVRASSIKQTTFDYLSSLEWVRARENLCLVGPAGTGKSHLLIALGHSAIEAGFRVRYFSAVELVETLYRGLADNSVGRVLEGILKADLILIDEIGFAPDGSHRRPTLLPTRLGRLRASLSRHCLTLALRGLGSLPTRAVHGCQPARPAAPSQRARRHRGRVVPHERGARGEENLGSEN